MGGLIGRIFREFAVTVSVAILVSTLVSLTLTPMMCAQLLRYKDPAHSSRLFRWSERIFEFALAVYERGLRLVLRHRTGTLRYDRDRCVDWLSLRRHSQRILPQQDTGFIVAVSEAAQDISYPAMLERQSRLVDILLKDPGIDGVLSAVGVGGVNQTVNNGRMFINLKPRAERDASASAIIDRLRPKLLQVPGIALFMQASQTSMSAPASVAPSTSSRYKTPISTSSIAGRRSFFARSKGFPSCATSPPTSRSPGPRCVSRSTATPLRASVSRPRSSTIRSTMPLGNARSRSSSLSRTITGSCSKSINASSSIPMRST